MALDQVRMLDRVLARFPGRAFAAVVVAAWAASARADLPIPPAPPAPDFVGDRAALSPSDRATKKEDAYVTGLPLASFDPNFGLGFGARANVFWNGPRDAPLFAYAPYAHRLSLTLFAATKGLQFHWLDYDAPFLGDTAYRVRAQAIFEKNIDRHYFGVGERSLAPLQYPGAPRAFSSLSDYEASERAVRPDGTSYARYDRLSFVRPAALFSLERSLLGGRLRPLVGAAVTYASVRDFSGQVIDVSGTSAVSARTRLREDCDAGRITGCDGGFDNFVRLALAYDTRDFEPDPTSGVFFDVGVDLGTKALGSRYAYARALAAGRVYVSPFPELTRLVIAARGVYEIESSGTPFFSLDVLPFTEDPKTGLGGFRTLRGFSQDRFVGPVMALANLEVRWQLATADWLGQHFGFQIAPFVDMGRVFDAVGRTTLRGWKRAEGAGLRIAWNQATIVMVDYGFSEEGSAIYINFGHIF